MSDHGRLTEKQRRFVEAYMGEADGNATEAARIAGYSGDEAALAVRGSENVRKRKIRIAIRERVKKDPLIATRKERQHFWTKVMHGELEGEDPTLNERLRASKLLGKSQADFVERHEHTGANGGPIEVRDVKVSDAELARIAHEDAEMHTNGHHENGQQ